MRATLFSILMILIFQQTRSQNVSINCIRYSEFVFSLIIKNNSNHSVFVPKDPIIQEGTDTIWIDNIFSFNHHHYSLFSYRINDSIVSINNELIGLEPLSKKEMSSNDGIPFATHFGELREIKPHELYNLRFGVKLRGALPHEISLRFYNQLVNYDSRTDLAVFQKNYSELCSSDIYTVIR